jgi:hypothetical protein
VIKLSHTAILLLISCAHTSFPQLSGSGVRCTLVCGSEILFIAQLDAAEDGAVASTWRVGEELKRQTVAGDEALEVGQRFESAVGACPEGDTPMEFFVADGCILELMQQTVGREAQSMRCYPVEDVAKVRSEQSQRIEVCEKIASLASTWN